MVDTSRRGRVGLGLVGLGPSWEQTYRNALIRLQNRLTIRLVYDPVEARARSVANDLDTAPTGSIRQMLQNTTLQGLLVLDPGWCAATTLQLVAGAKKPVFLGRPVLKHLRQWQARLRLHSQPDSMGNGHNGFLMPELNLRFTPASCRLQELMATRLGQAQHIEISCDLADNLELIPALIDWCGYILGRETAIEDSFQTVSSQPTSFSLQFPASTLKNGSSKQQFKIADFRQRTSDESPLRIRVDCERGYADLIHRTRIQWSTVNSSDEETLTDERTETEILIDQFCRRALGGLIPVGQLSDLLRAVRIVDAIIRPVDP